MQPYQGKRVVFVNPTMACEIIKNKNKIYDLYKIDKIRLARPGSTGGSLVVRSELFEKAGGYDPEFFWGYAPEDNFIWLKLEYLTNPEIELEDVHNGVALYADDPSMDVFHLDHPVVQKQNKDYSIMLEVYDWFQKAPSEEKEKFLDTKRSLLKEAKESLIK